MRTNVFCLATLMALLLTFGACSDDSTTAPDSSNPISQTQSIELFEAAKDVAPSFAEATAKNEWSMGSHMYELYNKFRVYDPAIHEGIIDGSNFFKAIHSLEEELGEMFEYAVAIDPAVIEEPFEFGNSTTYDFAANMVFSDVEGDADQSSFAYRIEGDAIHFLVAYAYNEDDDKMTMGQLQGVYNPVSGDLDLAMVYLVDYGMEQYTVRNEISGNTESHEFQLRMATSGSYGLGASVVGKGISEGEGAYFLIKMNVMDDMGDDLGERYFVFTSDADEAFVQAMDPDGLAFADLPDAVAAYATDVQTMEIFVEDNLPISLADFNGGDISLDF